MKGYGLFTIFLFVLLDTVEAVVQCGEWACYGAGAYCCEGHRTACCYHVWSFWWFWSFWVLIFTLMISCGFWCRRRHRRRPEYIIVRHPDTNTLYGATVYGAIGHVETPATNTYLCTPPTAPPKPPEYTNQKPPAYAPS